MIHCKFNPNSFSPICSSRGRNRHSVPREEFIQIYQQQKGRDCCSKCANYLINNKYMERADATLPSDVQLIINVLTEGTAVLREMFYQETEQYAVKKFSVIEALANKPLTTWYDQYGVNHVNGQLAMGEYNRRNIYRMRENRERLQKIANAGLDAFIVKAMKEAKAHYEESIAKLANRIQSQSLDISKLEVKTANIGRNIDTIISDGTQTVRAFTILAALDSTLVRPHYRYLIK